MSQRISTEVSGWREAARDGHLVVALLERALLAALCATLSLLAAVWGWGIAVVPVAVLGTTLLHLCMIRASGGTRVSVSRAEALSVDAPVDEG